MTPSKDARQIIEKYEGCILTARLDPLVKKPTPTVGFGHTGSDVIVGTVITQEKADELLTTDLVSFSHSVNSALLFAVPQSVFDAIISFTYNVGVENLKRSTLLKMVNQKDYVGASKQFQYWDNVDGEYNKGLHNRRLAETTLFLQDTGNDHLLLSVS